MPLPAWRFSHPHFNLMGPLPNATEGFNHLLTIVDHSSHWLEAIPLSSPTTDAIADALSVAGWPGSGCQITLTLTGAFNSAL